MTETFPLLEEQALGYWAMLKKMEVWAGVNYDLET